MNGTGLTPLRRPTSSTLRLQPLKQSAEGSIDASDGGSFHIPRLTYVRKENRVPLSSEAIQVEENADAFRLFAIANAKGWFVAATNNAIIMSPLKDLLSALEGDDKTKPPTFQCQRTLNMPYQPNIVALVNHESQLAVSLLNGDIHFYATDQLFSSGDAPPLQIIPGGPVRQLIPNPSNGPGLSDLLAIVRKDGRVHLINSQFQSQGGWEPADQESVVVAASWSPKGKQIALGLVLGDIVAFSPTNKTTVQKHIPPTHSVPNHLLVSLIWLPGPGHNFSTSYHEKNGDDKNTLHAVHLDKEVVIATEIDAPYIAAGRAPQATFPILLPKWDEVASDNSRFIFIIGDIQTADLGIFGYANGQWYHYPSDNVSVPLHEETMDDTILLSLDLDLVNPTGNPILYGYLNDGTIHAWNLNNDNKPYSGMLTASATMSSQSSQRPTPSSSGFSSFAQSPPATLSPPQQASPGFGQSSGFGTSSGFGQAGNNAFGGPSKTGSGSSAFGNGGSAFNTPGGGQQPTFGTQPSIASGGFGSVGSLGGGFGAFGSSNKSAFGGNNTTSSAFGGNQSSAGFGSSNTTQSAGFGSGFGSTPSNNTQEDSMSEDAPSFGGLSLGSGGPTSSPTASGGLFGSHAPLPPDSSQSSSTSVLKPASGFGAFGGGISADSPFNKPSATQSTSTFASTFSSAFGSSTPAFGQPSFGQPSKSGFGQPAFGQTGFGQRVAPPASTSKPISGGFGAFASNSPVSLNSAAKAPSSGGFGAFAGAPASLTSAAASSQPTKSSGGFASFAADTPSAFGAALPKQDEQKPSEPASGFAAFGAAGPSPFSASSPPKEETRPASGGFGAFASQSPTPFGSVSQKAEEQKPSASSSGFAAFTSASPSPFGQAAKPSSSGSETTKQSESASSFGTASGIPSLKDSPFGKGPFGNTPAPPVESSKSESPTPSSSWGSGMPPLANSPFGQGAFARSSDSTKDATPPTSPPTGSGIAPLTNSPFGKGAFASSSSSSQGSASPTSPSVTSPFNVTPSRPTPSNNAFSNLKTTSSFQPSAGFGAFGGSASNDSSPFFKAAETKSQPVSAFGTTPTTTPRPAATSTPTFGAPTSIGAKSAFAPQAPPTSTPPKTSTGGFSAFSGTKSAFGAASEKKTSFQELLTGKPGGKDPVKRFTSPPKANAETTAPKVEAEDIDRSTPKPVFSKPADVKGKGKEDTESLSKGDGSMSSVASSYVDVSHEDGDIRGGEEEDDDDDADSFLSQSVPSVGDLSDDEPQRDDEEDEESVDEAALEEGEPEEEGEEDAEEAEEDDDEQRSPTPSRIPLPSSRSSTASPSLASSLETVLPTIIEESTTPPGSPEKKATPVIPSTTPSASLGLGRPSTRPVRSSPLANTVPELEENEDVKPFAPKPRPASPKAPFGILPLKTEDSSTTTNARPKTPPLLSSFGGGGGLFGKPPPPVAAAAPTPPAPKSSPFGLQPFGSPSSPSPFVSPPPVQKPTAPSMFTPLNGPGFGSQAPPMMPPPSFSSGPSFGKLPTTPTPPIPPTAAQMNIPPRPSTVPQPPQALRQPVPGPRMDDFEEGMQRECARLYALMTKELDSLRASSAKAAQQRELLARKAGGSSTRADLADPQRWAPSDALKFRELLSTCTDDLEVSHLGNQAIRTALKELGSGLVKANTRKEEIERFNRAKEDEDFRKMLKARTLGPELVEMKTRLRGELMRKKQEVLRLEDVLKDNKKKMTAMKSQKGVFRSPSLDTVNRTYRNIDTAIRQEQEAIDSLTKRLAAVDIARRSLPPSKTSATYRDPRLPDAKSSPLAVPYEAVTTAAALNAERSAQKLKHALLKLRQQPLLNEPKTTTSPPLAFLSSSQASGSPGGVPFNTPLRVPNSLFGGGGDDDFHLNTYTSTSKVRPKERKHPSVPLTKKGDAPSASPSFDWGPLPQYGPGGFIAK